MLTLRNVKGTPLTNTEVDDNFQYLEDLIIDTDKYVTGVEVPGQFGISISLVDDLLPSVTVKPIASGEYSFATGNGSEASGDNSIALGNNSIASGPYSMALGNNSEADGLYAIALSNNSKALGNNSVTFGSYSETTGINSVTFGGNTKAIGSYSIAAGSDTESRGQYSVAISSIARNDAEVSIGINNHIGHKSQYGTINGKIATGNNAVTKINFGGNDYVLLSDKSAYRLQFTIMAISNTDAIEWSGTTIVKNGAFVGTPTLTPGISSPGFAVAPISVAVQLGTPILDHNILEVLATGIAFTDIKWSVKIDYVEINEVF